MKKIFLMMFIAVTFCGQAEAQKGMQGVGLNLAGNATSDFYGYGYGLGAKYQYNISNIVRIEPSFTYYEFTVEGFTMAGLVNLDIFLLKPRALRPYFFVGLGYIQYDYEDDPNKGFYFINSEKGLGLNTGLGLDWRLSNNWSLQMEAGALYGCDYINIKFNIGLSYNF